MLLLAGRDIGLDRVSRLAGSRQILQVLLRAISTVGQEAGGSLSALLLDHLHHWFDLLFIVGRRRHALPHDQLQPRLHCRLRVVALHQTIAAFHRARFGLGKLVFLFARGPRFLHFPARFPALPPLLPPPLLRPPWRR